MDMKKYFRKIKKIVGKEYPYINITIKYYWISNSKISTETELYISNGSYSNVRKSKIIEAPTIEESIKKLEEYIKDEKSSVLLGIIEELEQECEEQSIGWKDFSTRLKKIIKGE